MYPNIVNVPNYVHYTRSAKAQHINTFAQRGPTCGIYALAAVLQAYGSAILATKDHHQNAQANFSLRQKAKELGFTTIGELFNAEQVATLAQKIGRVGARAVSVGSVNFFAEIKKAIDQNKLVMIPFCVDDTPQNAGYPAQHGNNAHWCLALGYYAPNLPGRKVLVTHWDNYFDFDAAALQTSNGTMNTFAQSDWAKVGDIGTYEAAAPNRVYRKTSTIPTANLQVSLAKKIVVI